MRLCIALAWAGLAAPQLWAQSSGSAFTQGVRYDLARRIVGKISPDPDGAGSLAYLAVRNTFNAAGDLIKIEEGQLSVWPSETVAPAAWTGFTVLRTVDYSYDVMHRKVREARSGDATIYGVTEYSYDGLGRLRCVAVRMNDAAFEVPLADKCLPGPAGSVGPDRITKNVYDAAGRLLQIRKAVGVSGLEQAYATYSYTPNGMREYVIDAKGNRAKLVYDALDRQTDWLFPSTTGSSAFDGATPGSALSTAGAVNAADYEHYGYDANANRTSLRKRDGVVINYGYDALNRVTSKSGSGTPDVTYTYDLQGHQLTALFAGNGLGITSTYDGFGRQTSSTTTMGGGSRALSYQYDANGNRTRVTHPDGSYFVYEYDGLDRASSVLENGTLRVLNLIYEPGGTRLRIERLSGANTFYEPDPIGRPSAMTQDMAGTAQDVAMALTYNAASQVRTREISNDAYAWTQHYNVNRPYQAVDEVGGG